VELRPLQIVHGSCVEEPREKLAKLKDMGLGGVVANVPSEGYLESEEHWRGFGEMLAVCKQLGLRVWIYDEEGYPSGSAGGLVLRDHPDYEALALAFDETQPDPLAVRRAYEHTPAAQNYHLKRRMPNLIDDRAMDSFIEKTYDAYYRRFRSDFGGLIEAFFTDEPSLMVNFGPVPPDVEERVAKRGGDPIDPAVKRLPTVPWAYDLEARYRERYGEDILPLRRSLFEGDSPRDRETRERFWSLIGALFADRYTGALQKWCQAHGVAACGHFLAEGNLPAKIPLEGNALENLRRLDIPGMDMLSSDPRVPLRSGWIAAALPCSAALHVGRRRVMTETQHLSGRCPTAWPKATAAWQAAFGVTEFTLYYRTANFTPEEYRSYTDYVGRLNAVLREAQPTPRVLLYYPCADLRVEYYPTAEPLLDSKPQSARAREITDSFNELGRMLIRRQVPFALADDLAFDLAQLDGGCLRIGAGEFEALVMPRGVQLPASPVLRSWIEAGGQVIYDNGTEQELAESLGSLTPGARLDPSGEEIILGRFERDGRPILLLLNVGEMDYEGRVTLPGSGSWERWDLGSGEITDLPTAPDGRHALTLGSLEAVLLIGEG
jgi:hypothetical protein